MNTTLAFCPRCGQVEAIYIRDGEDLVCQLCREAVPASNPGAEIPPSRPTSRRFFRRVP